MKKTILILMLSVLVFACKKEDDIIKSTIIGTYDLYSKNATSYNIIDNSITITNDSLYIKYVGNYNYTTYTNENRIYIKSGYEEELVYRNDTIYFGGICSMCGNNLLFAVKN